MEIILGHVGGRGPQKQRYLLQLLLLLSQAEMLDKHS